VESVCWMNHFHFVVARTLSEKHLEKHIIPSKKERGKEITIKSRNIIFNLGFYVRKSILINILIKNTILEWFVIIFLYYFFLSSTFKINKDRYSCFCFCFYCIYYCCCLGFCVGICIPKQVNNVVVNCLGWN
jgi:hypothetical protein